MKKKQVVTVAGVLLIGFIVGRYSGAKGSGDKNPVRHVLYYVDPMHPSYRAEKPGTAPDCGMALVPVYSDQQQSAKPQVAGGKVAISAEQQQRIGVQLERVERNSGTRVVRTTGRVAADETRVHRVMAGTDGWVESVRDNPPGTLVKRNDLLATLYSKEFRNAEQAYISSVISLDRLKGVHEQTDSSRNDANIRINEEQLRSLGMGEPQIRELARTRQVTRDVAICSPIDGIVLSRSVAPGQRVENGTEFYRIADLSRVWILADLFGEESRLFSPGSRVRVTVRELGKTIYARVSSDPPLFDPQSRSLKLRLEADNPHLLLRPDMFVDLEFTAKAPAGLSVPQEAVLDSGRSKMVYVETGDGLFEGRTVETGEAYGNRVAIVRGLAEGERVVTSGTFLIDSESRMRSSVLMSSQTAHDALPGKDPGETVERVALPSRNSRRGND
jgi:RND family efflux transporter MFP subunit